MVPRRKPVSLRVKIRRGGKGQGEGASDDESVASFARRRLGREAFERLVQPLVAGIYTADPEQLSMAATMPQFWACERRHGSLGPLRTGRFDSTELAEVSDQSTNENVTAPHLNDATGARYALFAAPKNGMASLIQAAATCLPPNSIHLNTAVLSVRHSNNVWDLNFESKHPHSLLPTPHSHSHFDALILAIPAHAAAHLLAQRDPALAAELAAIPYAGCAVVSFGFTREQIGHPLDSFGFVVPQVERRRIIAASFASLKFPGRAGRCRFDSRLHRRRAAARTSRSCPMTNSAVLRSTN